MLEILIFQNFRKMCNIFKKNRLYFKLQIYDNFYSLPFNHNLSRFISLKKFENSCKTRELQKWYKNINLLMIQFIHSQFNSWINCSEIVVHDFEPFSSATSPYQIGFGFVENCCIEMFSSTFLQTRKFDLKAEVFNNSKHL